MTAWADKTSGWCFSQHEVRLLLTALACRSWTLSCYLHKGALRVSRTRSKIESYANRLEDQSTFFLYVLTKLRSHTTHEGPHFPGFEVTLWRLKVCYRLLKPFYALYQALCLYDRNSKDGNPVIEVTSSSGGRRFTIDPSTDTGHDTYEIALDQIENRVSAAILWTTSIVGPPLDHDDDLDSQMLIKLGQRPRSPYFRFTPRKIKHLDYTVKMKHKEKMVVCQPSKLIPANIHDYELPLKITPSQTRSISKDQALERVPNFDTLVLTRYDSQFSYRSLTFMKLHVGNKSVIEKLNERYWSDLRCSYNLGIGIFSSELFRSDLDRARAGQILLWGNLFTACEYGRPKKLAVMLFENRLVFLRMTLSAIHVHYDIPVEHLLQVTHRIGKPGTGILTVFWDAEPDGPHEVAGAELFFDDIVQMLSWAGWLALAILPRSGTEMPSRTISSEAQTNKGGEQGHTRNARGSPKHDNPSQFTQENMVEQDSEKGQIGCETLHTRIDL